MNNAGLDDMMETDLPNMAERDAEVEMVMINMINSQYCQFDLKNSNIEELG